jgi:hypothetical protein
LMLGTELTHIDFATAFSFLVAMFNVKERHLECKLSFQLVITYTIATLPSFWFTNFV